MSPSFRWFWLIFCYPDLDPYHWYGSGSCSGRQKLYGSDRIRIHIIAYTFYLFPGYVLFNVIPQNKYNIPATITLQFLPTVPIRTLQRMRDLQPALYPTLTSGQGCIKFPTTWYFTPPPFILIFFPKMSVSLPSSTLEILSNRL